MTSSHRNDGRFGNSPLLSKKKLGALCQGALTEIDLLASECTDSGVYVSGLTC